MISLDSPRDLQSRPQSRVGDTNIKKKKKQLLDFSTFCHSFVESFPHFVKLSMGLLLARQNIYYDVTPSFCKPRRAAILGLSQTSKSTASSRALNLPSIIPPVDVPKIVSRRYPKG